MYSSSLPKNLNLRHGMSHLGINPCSRHKDNKKFHSHNNFSKKTPFRNVFESNRGRYRSLEPQTVNFPRKVIRSYTPACAKPLVTCWHFLFLFIVSLLFSFQTAVLSKHIAEYQIHISAT